MFRSAKILTVIAALLISGILLSACNAVEPVVEPFHSDVDVTAPPLSESNAIPYDDMDSLNIDSSTVTDAAWSPDESLVAVGYDDGWVSIFSAENGELLHEFADNEVAVASLAWSSDGAEFIATDVEGEVSFYRISQ
jgi:WD40 repeat protein